MKKQVKYYYVYIITNTVINKQYVGSRICYKDTIEEDNYMGTSKYLNEDYKIYGIENFTKIILKRDYQNAQDMLNGETKYILEYNTLAPNGYNRFLPNTKNGFHMAGATHVVSDECKKKMSLIQKGKPKYKLRGRPLSFKHKKHLSESNKGISRNKNKKHSEESKTNMSKSHINSFLSYEHKKHISESNKGRKLSKEHIINSAIHRRKITLEMVTHILELKKTHTAAETHKIYSNISLRAIFTIRAGKFNWKI